jgi:NAD(P)-dependent dehydrogenase (short-subunit alcohol dehydrogenase family)
MPNQQSRPLIEGQIALVVGVGPGLGAALTRRLGEAGMRVGIAARRSAVLSELARERVPEGAEVAVFECDATREDDVNGMFESILERWGAPDLVVYNAGKFARSSVLHTDAATFEQCWRVGCFGAFLVGRAAALQMAERGSGTILYTGATASVRGGEGFSCLAVEKFGMRALAQVMARELGPRGIHVAHVIIDGRIVSERYRELAKELPPAALLAPGAIADTYLHLHRQHRSAWTHELDLRPWTEVF